MDQVKRLHLWQSIDAGAGIWLDGNHDLVEQGCYSSKVLSSLEAPDEGSAAVVPIQGRIKGPVSPCVVEQVGQYPALGISAQLSLVGDWCAHLQHFKADAGG